MTFHLHNLLSVHRRIPHQENDAEVTFEAVSKANSDANSDAVLRETDETEDRQDASDSKDHRAGSTGEDETRTLLSPPMLRRMSHHSLGFRPLLVEQFDDESDILCDLHFGVLKDPARCSHCGARFCMPCFETWQTRKTGNCDRCPLCMLILTPESIYRDEELQNRLIEARQAEQEREGDGNADQIDRSNSLPDDSSETVQDRTAESTKHDEELCKKLLEAQRATQDKLVPEDAEQVRRSISPKSIIELDSKRQYDRTDEEVREDGQERRARIERRNGLVGQWGDLVDGEPKQVNSIISPKSAISLDSEGHQDRMDDYVQRAEKKRPVRVERRHAISGGRLSRVEERLTGFEEGPTSAPDAEREKLVRVERRHAISGGRLSRLEGRLVRSEEGLLGTPDAEEGLATVEGRWSGSDEVLIDTEGRLTGSEDQWAGIEGHLRGFKEDLTGIEDRLTDVEGRMQGSDGRLARVEGRLTGFEEGLSGTLECLLGAEDHEPDVFADDNFCQNQDSLDPSQCRNHMEVVLKGSEKERLVRVERLQASADGRLRVEQERMTGCEEGLAGAEQRLIGVEERLNGIEKRVNGMEAALQEIFEEQKRDREAFFSREKSILESKKKDREALVYLLSFTAMLLAYPYPFVAASK